MRTLTTRQVPFNSLAHIPVDEPLKAHLSSIKSDVSIQQMDQFYLDMLEQFSPVAQKQRYLDQLDRCIEGLFRVDGVLVAAFYTNSTIQCFNQTVETLIESISQAPLSVGRINFILQNHYPERVTLDFYTRNHPTHHDLIRGFLYQKADLDAGFEVDETSLEELMCDWLQHYQLWMQDYLFFNLAQISAEKRNTPNTHKFLFDHRPTDQEKITEIVTSAGSV